METKKGKVSVTTENIFPVIRQWLYEDKDIFVRELVSNCADAISKHRRLAELGKAEAGADPKALATLIKGFPLQVLGCGDPKQAQVTRGGAALAEFDPVTLRSRLSPRLFAAGEALDIDGRCGGFNLHWAFASGITAARAAMEDLI